MPKRKAEDSASTTAAKRQKIVEIIASMEDHMEKANVVHNTEIAHRERTIDRLEKRVRDQKESLCAFRKKSPNVVYAKAVDELRARAALVDHVLSGEPVTMDDVVLIHKAKATPITEFM